jgi:hypothetical protein
MNKPEIENKQELEKSQKSYQFDKRNCPVANYCLENSGVLLVLDHTHV